MSYTFLQEQGEESSAECFSDIPASVLSRLSLTAEKSCSNDNETDAALRLRRESELSAAGAATAGKESKEASSRKRGEALELNDAIADAVDELWHDPRQNGDILVFLSGEREIRETAESLRKHHPQGCEILPLYSRLAQRINTWLTSATASGVLFDTDLVGVRVTLACAEIDSTTGFIPADLS